MRARWIAGALGLMSFAETPRAWAQRLPGDGLDTHLFRPALDSKGFFAVNGSDVLPGGQLSTGLVLDYGHQLLRVSPGADGKIIRHAFAGTFQFDYGIADRAFIGLSMPAILMSGPGGLDVQAIQHIALQSKVKLADWLAVGVQIGVPLGDASRDGGAEPAVWFWPRAIFEKRTDRFRFAVEAGWRGHAASDTRIALDHGELRDGSRLTYGAAASYRILEPVDVVVETYATYLLNDSAPALRASNEALGGIKVFVEKSSYLMLGAGPRYTSGFEAADVRAVVGFVFEPRMEPRGGGGERETEPPPLAHIPLPPPPADPEPSDYDVDGIPDAEDKCPTQAGPPRPDNPQWHGCPDVRFGPGQLFILKEIRFEVNSAKILPESDPILDSLAKVLTEHPELALLEIAGHADERGGEKYNLNLTQARVSAVMDALVRRRIDRRRLRAKGYGFYCPLVAEHDEAAWKQNRRVELKIVKGGPDSSPAPLGCENAIKHGVRPDPIPE